MRFSKSTRYALYAVMEMALSDVPVAVTNLARQYQIPEGALAKVFQTLVRVGIARGVRGAGGGYHLAKEPAAITVLDVISVFDPPRQMGACLLAAEPDTTCHEEQDCRLRRLFDEVDEMARSTFASVTIETLVR